MIMIFRAGMIVLIFQVLSQPMMHARMDVLLGRAAAGRSIYIATNCQRTICVQGLGEIHFFQVHTFASKYLGKTVVRFWKPFRFA